MAKGEMRYNSTGKQVVRFENKPIPRGDYQLTLLADDLKVKRSEEKGPDAVPYIGARFAAGGTAAKEGGKDRLVFVNFFLSMKPGSDGQIMPERGGGLVEYCRAHGEEADFAIRTLEKSDGTTEDYFDAEEVLEYLNGKTDTTIQGHVIIEKAKDRQGNAIEGHPGNNKVGHWNVSEEVVTGAAPSAPPAPVKGKATPLKAGADKKK
jgi:hypothetical protein